MKHSVQKTEQVLADLNAQRDALIARGHELEKRRQAIAFDAHTGNKAQRAKLDEINQRGSHPRVRIEEPRLSDCGSDQAF